ncbi:MAG TPA: cytochrome P450, partial [Polyangiales bacterium]|nr:cytochrome P450 [Polyangiales bacterium]
PRHYPLIGAMADMRRDPIGFLTDLHSHYGPVAFTKLGMANAYFLSSPDLIEDVLVGKHRNFCKDFATRELEPLVGKGLLTADGDEWLQQRRLAQPPLQPKRIASYAQTMTECAERLFDSFRDDEVRDISLDMAHLTLEIAGRCLLGADPRREAERIGHIMEVSMVYFDRQLRTLEGILPKWLPTPDRVRMKAATDELDTIIYRIIERCRRDGAEADHLLGRLVNARDEDGHAMSDKQLRDEAVTMLLAGHETTALTLAYAIYLLSEHPDVAASVRAEVDGTLGGRTPAFEDLPKLKRVDAVVRETLRLFPPAYIIAREVVEPIQLGEFLVPKGDQVLMSPYAMHHDPRWFREPERFDPTRWTNGETSGLPKFAYFPFGGGPRVCIGIHFAIMEAVLVLASLLQHSELSVVPGYKVEVDPIVTLRPRNAIRAQVRRRKLAARYRAA